MTLTAFRDILLGADPKAQHYWSSRKDNYTCWTEYGRKPFSSNNRYGDGVLRIQVDRFTKKEFDPIVIAISEALDRDEIAYVYTMDTERDTGFIHHIWDCEVA